MKLLVKFTVYIRQNKPCQKKRKEKKNKASTIDYTNLPFYPSDPFENIHECLAHVSVQKRPLTIFNQVVIRNTEGFELFTFPTSAARVDASIDLLAEHFPPWGNDEVCRERTGGRRNGYVFLHLGGDPLGCLSVFFF